MSNRILTVALGNDPADLILKNSRVVDVVTESIYDGDIAIVDGLIAGVGKYDLGKKVIDLKGAFVTPGFINAHLHVESSMATPEDYCAEELNWGVTTLVTDPHEIANVAGARGIRYMLEAGGSMPINYYVQLPSCVPATPFESSGTVMHTKDMILCMDWSGVLGMGEMMNVPGVLNQDTEVMQKLQAFRRNGRPIDGHAPCVSGRELAAYVGQGITTDHESISWDEAKEKLRNGVAVWVREGSASRNLQDIIAGAIKDKVSFRRMGFCTDDKHLADIHKEGTVRAMVLKAINLGVPVCTALAMATFNPAQVYGLKHLGEIAPGKQADLVVWNDLENLKPLYVFYKGEDALAKMQEVQKRKISSGLLNTVHLADFTQKDLCMPWDEKGEYPVIELLPCQIITGKSLVKGKDIAKRLQDGSLAYISVLERHHATGNIGKGFISGYGIKNGAAATTVAHDSHNLLVVGTDAVSMETAVLRLQEIGGGYALASGEHILGTVALDVAGLMSSHGSKELTESLDKISKSAHEMGVPDGVDPFVSLSFMALPVIPKLKITDKGLFDVEKFSFIN